MTHAGQTSLPKWAKPSAGSQWPIPRAGSTRPTPRPTTCPRPSASTRSVRRPRGSRSPASRRTAAGPPVGLLAPCPTGPRSSSRSESGRCAGEPAPPTTRPGGRPPVRPGRLRRPGREQPQRGHVAGEPVVQGRLPPGRCLGRETRGDPGGEVLLGGTQRAVLRDLGHHRRQAADSGVQRVAVVRGCAVLPVDRRRKPRTVVLPHMAQDPRPGALTQLPIGIARPHTSRVRGRPACSIGLLPRGG